VAASVLPLASVWSSLRLGITAETKVTAVIAQAAADTTALMRSAPSARPVSVTLYLNAAATAAVAIDWYFVNPSGLTPKELTFNRSRLGGASRDFPHVPRIPQIAFISGAVDAASCMVLDPQEKPRHARKVLPWPASRKQSQTLTQSKGAVNGQFFPRRLPSPP
jgi:hypothetical protein